MRRTLAAAASILLALTFTVTNGTAVAVPAQLFPIGAERPLPGILILDITPNDDVRSSIRHLEEQLETVVATDDGFLVFDTTDAAMTRRETLGPATRIDRSDDGTVLVASSGADRIVTFSTAGWQETAANDLPDGTMAPEAISLAPGSTSRVLVETPDGALVVDGDLVVVELFDTLTGITGPIGDVAWGRDTETLFVLVGDTLADVDISTGTPVVSDTLDLPAGTNGPLLWLDDTLAVEDGFTIDLDTWQLGETFPTGVVPAGSRHESSVLLRNGLEIDQRLGGTAGASFEMAPPFDDTVQWMVPAGDTRFLYVDDDGLLRVADIGVLASSAGDFHPVTPARIFDSRIALGQPTTEPFAAEDARSIQVTGVAGIPAGEAIAVVVNVTVTDASEPTFVSLYPSGEERPVVSVVNIDTAVAGTGLAVANLATVPVGADGTITAFNALGTAHVIVDIAGFYSTAEAEAGARYVPLDAPTRLADTREGELGGPFGADTTRTLDLSGELAGHSGAVAAVVQLTAIAPTEPTFITAAPGGAPLPLVSNVNPFPGRVSPNLAVVMLSDSDTVDLYNLAGAVHLAVDLVGFYEERAGRDQNGRFLPVAPFRLLDTRETSPFDAPGTIPANGSVVFPSVGIADFTPIAGGEDTGWTYLMNLTAVTPTTAGFLTTRPVVLGSDFEQPTTSNVNFEAGEVRANHAYVVADPEWEAFNSHGQTHVLVDIFGAITPVEARIAEPGFGE